eukprot:SAG25_NODE_727_length_5698_cov_2.832649_5_plen_316_part_00
MGRGEGRGDGKGSYWDAFQELSQALQCAACTVCIMIIIGPILMFVGIGYLGDATTDSRSIAIEKLRPVVNKWMAGGARAEFTASHGVRGSPRTYEVSVYYSQQIGSICEPEPPSTVAGSMSTSTLALKTDGDAVPDLGSQPKDAVHRDEWTAARYESDPSMSITPTTGDAGSSWHVQVRDVSPGAPAPNTLAHLRLPLCAELHSTMTGCRVDCSGSSSSSSSSRRRRRSSSSSSCVSCRSKCEDMGGTYQGQQLCTVYEELQQVGILVKGAARSGDIHGCADSGGCGLVADGDNPGTACVSGFAESLPAHNPNNR